jgi:adenosylmethionine-8-amino-7-oxononanoate aminotransferase
VTLTPQELQDAAKQHLWMHFTRMSTYNAGDIPVIVRGSGPYVYDDKGKRYLDGLAGLFVSMVGHGRTELAEAASKQASELAYFPLWSYAHPSAVELAARLAALAPGDLNRVFFTTSGSEAVESAWKLAKQYFKLRGEPGRYKVISRDIAYHGTSMGALAITGLAAIKADFEPLPPGGVRVPNTNFYRAPAFAASTPEEFGIWAADEIERAILREGPESVACVFLEPVQNSGGCFPPPPGYFQRVRSICDKYGVLLVSDEVICAFGRLGYYFGSERYGYLPDIITFAKGVTSGYSPMGGMIVREHLMEPFRTGTATFLHGITFAGHADGNSLVIGAEPRTVRNDLNAGFFRCSRTQLTSWVREEKPRFHSMDHACASAERRICSISSKCSCVQMSGGAS